MRLAILAILAGCAGTVGPVVGWSPQHGAVLGWDANVRTRRQNTTLTGSRVQMDGITFGFGQSFRKTDRWRHILYGNVGWAYATAKQFAANSDRTIAYGGEVRGGFSRDGDDTTPMVGLGAGVIDAPAFGCEIARAYSVVASVRWVDGAIEIVASPGIGIGNNPCSSD